jgi:para-aminobenzoate synthetase/4-amino-4-deoxychorismate lyase
MQTTFSLLETMRLEDGHIPRLERHLARMAASANHFGFRWSEAHAAAAVEDARVPYPLGTWRLRLLLDPEGGVATTCTAHDGGKPRVWRVALATRPIDSSDPLLRHKTTSRALYDTARHEQPHMDDVLLWNERGEVTEGTIANVVAEIDGARVTPPVTCGLLPGVYRAELLDAGEIRERVVTTEELKNASRLWLINSLRGWIDVQVVSGRS